MFCENCGRKSNPAEKFCADCGTPLRTSNGNVNIGPVPVQNKVVNKKKPKTGLILGIVFGCIALFVALIVGIIAVAFSFVNNYETKEYIEIGNDKIPTIYSAVGQKDIMSINKSLKEDNNTTTLVYYADDFTAEDLDAYSEVLLDEDFSEAKDETNIFMYVRESSDTGNLVFVYANFDYSNDTLVFTYIKKSGDIDDYVLSNSNGDTIRVGAKGYGFIDVPDTFERYTGSSTTDEVLQYSNEEKTLLITLSSLENSEFTIDNYVSYFAEDYKDEGATVKLGNEVVDEYNAYTILAAFEDGWITKEWLLIDKNNNLYYVYMGTYDDTYIFDYIQTYGIES